MSLQRRQHLTPLFLEQAMLLLNLPQQLQNKLLLLDNTLILLLYMLYDL